MVAVKPRLLSVQDYHHMIEAGIFGPEERIELITGQLMPMAAKGAPHRAAVTRARRLLEQHLGARVLVCVQDSVQLDDYSEPEPDIAVVKPEPLDYEERHPTVADTFLILEVSDWTLAYDLDNKALAYARSGVKDYWVLDIKGRRLHVFRQPSPSGYQNQVILTEDANIAPLTFPDCILTVKELLRPLM